MSIEEARRPGWVLPVLAEYGEAKWRARFAWLRARLEASGHRAAFFADAAGGVFNESFPAIEPFPARALLVPLDGKVALDAHGATRRLGPPRWEHGEGGAVEALVPAAAPQRVPFGAAHAVRALGPKGATACWAYVFGVDPEEEGRLLAVGGAAGAAGVEGLRRW